MSTKVQFRAKAIALRKQGKSYSEILKVVPVSKGTLSKWLSSAPLSKKEEKYLKERTKVLQDNGRMKVGAKNRDRFALKREQISTMAKVDFQRYKDDPFFTLGVALYWASGSKTGNYFDFTSSDVKMVKTLLLWMERYLRVEPADYRFRLYISKSVLTKQPERYWSRQCAVPLSQFKDTIATASKKSLTLERDEKGSLRVIVPGIEQLLILKTWQTELSLYHVGTL